MNKKGVGLGLVICKKIVTQLGPYKRIFVSSQLGQGTKMGFFVFLEEISIRSPVLRRGVERRE
jgi:signal transduction histidine kinase